MTNTRLASNRGDEKANSLRSKSRATTTPRNVVARRSTSHQKHGTRLDQLQASWEATQQEQQTTSRLLHSASHHRLHHSQQQHPSTRSSTPRRSLLLPQFLPLTAPSPNSASSSLEEKASEDVVGTSASSPRSLVLQHVVARAHRARPAAAPSVGRGRRRTSLLLQASDAEAGRRWG